jgi:enoyl-CoA hydratase/carnithine racemase
VLVLVRARAGRVVPKAQVEEATLELAKKIVSYSPSVMGLGKKAFYQQMAQPDLRQARRPDRLLGAIP